MKWVREDKLLRLRNWHPWFAWRPVKFGRLVKFGLRGEDVKRWIWLEMVWRRKVSVSFDDEFGGGFEWKYEYADDLG